MKGPFPYLKEPFPYLKKPFLYLKEPFPFWKEPFLFGKCPFHFGKSPFCQRRLMQLWLCVVKGNLKGTFVVLNAQKCTYGLPFSPAAEARESAAESVRWKVFASAHTHTHTHTLHAPHVNIGRLSMTISSGQRSWVALHFNPSAICSGLKRPRAGSNSNPLMGRCMETLAIWRN
jgi:hypothetical protein